MVTLEILKELDNVTQQANSLWNQCESLKLRIAKEAGISHKRITENGIYAPEAKEESNAAVKPRRHGD